MKNIIARMVLVTVQVVMRRVVTVMTERNSADGGAMDGPKSVRATVVNFESIWQNHTPTRIPLPTSSLCTKGDFVKA